MGKLEGRTALVTGASRGIGRAIALRLAEEGALVAVHYGRQEAAAREVMAEIEARGGAAFLLGADLRDLAAVAAMFDDLDRALAARGADRLHILVNNAGIGGIGSMLETDEALFDDLFAVNVKGLFFVTKHALPRLADGGRIINLSSMVSKNAYPGFIAYAATKAAVDSLTLSLAAELGPRGITVNAVAPGATATDFIGPLVENREFMAALEAGTALRRIGTAEDIADVVAFLVSHDGRWITGERVRASGGMHL